MTAVGIDGVEVLGHEHRFAEHVQHDLVAARRAAHFCGATLGPIGITREVRDLHRRCAIDRTHPNFGAVQGATDAIGDRQIGKAHVVRCPGRFAPVGDILVVDNKL